MICRRQWTAKTDSSIFYGHSIEQNVLSNANIYFPLTFKSRYCDSGTCGNEKYQICKSAWMCRKVFLYLRLYCRVLYKLDFVYHTGFVLSFFVSKRDITLKEIVKYKLSLPSNGLLYIGGKTLHIRAISRIIFVLRSAVFSLRSKVSITHCLAIDLHYGNFKFCWAGIDNSLTQLERMAKVWKSYPLKCLWAN